MQDNCVYKITPAEGKAANWKLVVNITTATTDTGSLVDVSEGECQDIQR